MLYKFKVNVDFKVSGTPDNQYTPFTQPLKFPTITELLVNNSNKYGENGGYQVIDWQGDASYRNQDLFDSRDYFDHIFLENGSEITINTDNPAIFDKLRIKWAKCGCAVPIVYRAELNLISNN
jgi:hypothetical protein